MEEGESSCVKVVIHARPLLRTDGPEAKSAVEVCPKNKQVTITTSAKSYFYDHVFDGNRSSTHEIYAKAVSPLVDTLFKGYNATVAAYGQTGSGKTFTMGSEGGEGLIADANLAIFERLTRCRHQVTVRVSFVEVYKEKMFDLLQHVSKPGASACSSAVPSPAAAATKTAPSQRSRLPATPATCTAAAPKGRSGQPQQLLPLGGRSDTISLDIASQHAVTRPSEVVELLRCGAAMRRTADNGKNARSSRSHAIFSITVEQRPRPSGAAAAAAAAGGGTPCSPGAARATQAAGEAAGLDTSSISLGFDDVPYRDSGLGAAAGGGGVEEPSLGLAELLNSRMHFVDLAGSETISEGGDRAETRTINQSLLTFQRVLRVLADHKPDAHVPYRESLLTRLLQEALGGNSRTLMIACISPAWATRLQTSSTLDYAAYARSICNKPRINRKSLAEVNEELGDQVAWLQRENRELRAHLAAAREAAAQQGAAATHGGDADSASDVWSDAGGNGGGYKRLYEDEAEKLLRVTELLECREHELVESQLQAAEAQQQLAAASKDAAAWQQAAGAVQQQVLELRESLVGQLAAAAPGLQQQQAAWAAAAAQLQQVHGVQLQQHGGEDIAQALGSFWVQGVDARAAGQEAGEAHETLRQVQQLVGGVLKQLAAGQAGRGADLAALQAALQQQVVAVAAQQQEAAQGALAALRQQQEVERVQLLQEVEAVQQQLAAAQAALEQQRQAAQAGLQQAAQQQAAALETQLEQHTAALRQQASQHAAALQQQEVEHAAALLALQQEQESAVFELQEQQQEALAAHQQQQEEAEAQLQQQHQDALAAEQKVAQVQQLAKEEAQKLRQGMERLQEAAAAAQAEAAARATCQQQLQQALQAQGGQLNNAQAANRRLLQQLEQREAAAGSTEAQLQSAVAAGAALQKLCKQLQEALTRHSAQQKVAAAGVAHLQRRVTDSYHQKLKEGLGLVRELHNECNEVTHLLERTASDTSQAASDASDAIEGAGRADDGLGAASEGSSLLCDSSSGTCSEQEWGEELGVGGGLDGPCDPLQQQQQQQQVVAPLSDVPGCQPPKAVPQGPTSQQGTSVSSPCKPQVQRLCSQGAVHQRVEQLQAVIQQQRQEQQEQQQQQGSPISSGRALDGMKAQYPILPSRHPRGLACTPAKQLKQQQEGLYSTSPAREVVSGATGSPAPAPLDGGGGGTIRARRRWGAEQQEAAGSEGSLGVAAAAAAAGQGVASPLLGPSTCASQSAQLAHDQLAEGWEGKEEAPQEQSGRGVAARRAAAGSPVTGDMLQRAAGASPTSPGPTPAPHSTPREGLPVAAGHPDMSPASLWSRVTKIMGSLGKTKGRQGTPQQQDTPASGPGAVAGARSSSSKTKSRIGALQAGSSQQVTAEAAQVQAQVQGRSRDPVVQQLFSEGERRSEEEQDAVVGAAAGVAADSSKPTRSQRIPLAGAVDDVGPLDRRSHRSDQSGASSSILAGGRASPVACWPLVYEAGLAKEQELQVLALVGSTRTAHLKDWLKGKQLRGMVWVAKGKRQHELMQDVLAYHAAQQQGQQQLLQVSAASGGSRGPSRAEVLGSGGNSRSSMRAADGNKGYMLGGSTLLQQQQYRQVVKPIDIVDLTAEPDVQVRGDVMAPSPEQRRAIWHQDPALRSRGAAEVLPPSSTSSARAAAGGAGGGAARMQLYKEAARRAWGSNQDAAASSSNSSAYPAQAAAGAAPAAAGVRGPVLQLPGYAGELGRHAAPLSSFTSHTRSTQPSPVLTSPTTRAADVAAAAARYKAGRAGPLQAAPPPPALAAAATGVGGGGTYGGLPPPVLIMQAKLQAQARR